MSHFDVIVVGAGAIGAATTWKLALRGAKVLVLEREHVELHEAGERHERLGRRAGHEVVEGDGVAALAQRRAHLDDGGRDLHALEDLEHHLLGIEQAARIGEQRLHVEVDEGTAAVGERVEADAEQRVADDTGRDAAVRLDAGVGGRRGAVEQFVAEDLLTRIENRLAGDVNLIDGNCHSASFIGRAARVLNAGRSRGAAQRSSSASSASRSVREVNGFCSRCSTDSPPAKTDSE